MSKKNESASQALDIVNLPHRTSFGQIQTILRVEVIFLQLGPNPLQFFDIFSEVKVVQHSLSSLLRVAMITKKIFVLIADSTVSLGKMAHGSGMSLSILLIALSLMNQKNE